MRKVEAADRAGWPHGAALGELDSGGFLNVQQFPKNPLLSVIRTGRVTGGRPNAAIFLPDQLLIAEIFRFAVAPLLARSFVQAFSKGLGEAVSQGFGHDRIIVVMILLEAGAQFVHTKTRRNSEGTEVIANSSVLRCNKISQGMIELVL